MLKRKFESNSVDGDTTFKEETTPPPSQKTARLDNASETEQPDVHTLAKKPKQAPLSPLTSGSLGGEQTRLPRDSSKQTTPEHQRKRSRELSCKDTQSRKKARKSGQAQDTSSIEQLPLKIEPAESNAAVNSSPITASAGPVRPGIVPGTNPVGEVQKEEKKENKNGQEEGEEEDSSNFVKYWARHQVWPKKFAQQPLMTTISSDGKRRRTSDAAASGGNERARSWSQSRKEGAVPEQYSPKYEAYILTKGLDMDILRGEGLVLADSRTFSRELLQVSRPTIEPTLFPDQTLRKVIISSQNRNEALVNRDITPLIVPPIKALYFGGDEHLEHVCDEVNTSWFQKCVLAGPIIRPDLAIGFFASAFTDAELNKLDSYEAVLNWTQVTGTMYFPFLMCEVKCGVMGLDEADRQNMHSCSVALRAILRLEQEADRYREKPKLADLNGQVLVFSLSHDQKNVRLYGHYAEMKDAKWIYHRYPIGDFNIALSEQNLLIVHNFVRNVLDTYASMLGRRLKDAVAALPEPTGLSFSVDDVTLENEAAQRPASPTAGPAAAEGDDAPSQDWGRSISYLRTSERVAFKEQMKAIMQQNEQLRQDQRDAQLNAAEEARTHREQAQVLVQLNEQLRQEKRESELKAAQENKEQKKQMQEQIRELGKQMQEQREIFREQLEQQKELISLLKKS